MDWTLLTVVLFHMRGLCVSKNSFIYSCLFSFIVNKTKKLPWIMWLAPLLIIISIILRFIAWNEYIIPHLNSDKFWLEWYMKIYYPTYTRLDSLAIGVLIGYLHHHSATFKRFIHSNGNILFFSGAILLGYHFCSAVIRLPCMLPFLVLRL